MRYDYHCDHCNTTFEYQHGMKETPSVCCPKCGKAATRMMPKSVQGWIRGNGIVKDKRGARRDMNLHTLTKHDPYAKMREKGEKEVLIDKLRRGGKIIKTGKILCRITEDGRYLSPCPKCDGDGCRSCDNSGFITR